MTEVTNMQNHRNTFRHRLLGTASATILLASIVMAQQADAADRDHSMVWIELGGAFDQMTSDADRWLPSNLTPPITNPPPGPFGAMPNVGYDSELKIDFVPAASDWIFSVGIRYGRARSKPKHSHDQSYHVTGYITSFGSKKGSPKYLLTNYDFTDAARQSLSTHLILDFQAGKDVGLGLFGGSSVLKVGVRVAKLNENAEGHFTGFVSAPAKYSPGEVVHVGSFGANHNFTGIGPSISWDASAPFVGNLTEGFSFDWGATAALLFGRQKANVSLHTKDTQYYPPSADSTGVKNVLSHSTENLRRSRNVLVPNVGGFAGLSWRLPNAKISLGYRADFFFGAIDAGIETAHREDRDFYGPFANVSIGLGG